MDKLSTNRGQGGLVEVQVEEIVVGELVTGLELDQDVGGLVDAAVRRVRVGSRDREAALCVVRCRGG